MEGNPIEARRMNTAIDRFLGTLPYWGRRPVKALLLRSAAGKKYEYIAEALGVQPRQAMSLAKHGREILDRLDARGKLDRDAVALLIEVEARQ